MLRLEVKPNQWNCLATAMAMALDISTADFFASAGHDGSEIIYQGFPEPINRRGHHIQEAVHVATKRGFSVTPFQLFPQTAPAKVTRGHHQPYVVRYDNHERLHHNWDLFKDLIATTRGVIECDQKSPGGHALAYDNNYIFDPDGRSFHYSREALEELGLFSKCLWRVTK